jgi:hypothetical protein
MAKSKKNTNKTMIIVVFANYNITDATSKPLIVLQKCKSLGFYMINYAKNAYLAT